MTDVVLSQEGKENYFPKSKLHYVSLLFVMPEKNEIF